MESQAVENLQGDKTRTDVNQVKTPNNPTMVDQIRENNAGDQPKTSYGRAMSM